MKDEDTWPSADEVLNSERRKHRAEIERMQSMIDDAVAMIRWQRQSKQRLNKELADAIALLRETQGWVPFSEKALHAAVEAFFAKNAEGKAARLDALLQLQQESERLGMYDANPQD